MTTNPSTAPLTPEHFRKIHHIDPPAPAPLSPEREQEIRQGQPGDWLPGPWTIHQTDGTPDTHGHWQLIHHQKGTVLATLPDWAGNVALWAADAHEAVPELLAELDRVRAENARLLAERHSTNEALADLTLARYTDTDVLRVELASAQRQWEHWAREAAALRERVAELEAERLREGQLAEQRHALLDLDPDSCCRPAGFTCPNACPAPELEATR